MGLNWDRLGESAFVLRNPPAEPALLAATWNLQKIPGLIEAVPAMDSVGVYVDPATFEGLDQLAMSVAAHHQPNEVTIPVCYELGEDLQAVADELELPIEDVIFLHSRATYRCAAIGFCPGFPYLTGLPEPLKKIGRRASPRTRVDAGSVAIAAGQAGVYPMDRPGGWALLGRTPCLLVDVDKRYFPIAPGDFVRFEPIPPAEYDLRKGERL